jgi:hypothetical protein
MDSIKNFIISIWIAVAGLLPVSHAEVNQPAAFITPTPTPIVEIMPSERALKVASYGWFHMTEENKVKIKKDNGNPKANDDSAIKEWAVRMDRDPILLAKNEAKMQKMIEEATQPKVIYQTEYIDNSNNSRIDDVQDKISNLTSDIEDEVDEQRRETEDAQREIDNLKRDMRWNCINAGGSPVGTSCL